MTVPARRYVPYYYQNSGKASGLPLTDNTTVLEIAEDDSYVQHGGSPTGVQFEYTDPFSVSFLYKGNVGATSGVVISKMNENQQTGWRIRANNDFSMGMSFATPADGDIAKVIDELVDDSGWSTSEYRRFTMTYDGSGSHTGVIWYTGEDVSAINGTESGGTITGGSILTGAFLSQGTLNNRPDVANMDGRIGEVVVFDKELSAAEVSEIYNSGKCGTDFSESSVAANIQLWCNYHGAAVGADNVPDLSGNDNHGTLTDGSARNFINDIPCPSESPYSTTISFEETGSTFVNVPNNATYQLGRDDAQTYGLWIKTADESCRMFEKLNAGLPQGIRFATDTGLDLRVSFFTVGEGIDLGTPNFALPNNAWSFVTVSHDGSGDPSTSTVKIHINGVSQTVSLNGGSITSDFKNTTNGLNWMTISTALFTHMSVWDTELSTSTVLELYNEGVPLDLSAHPTSTNLIGWWHGNAANVGASGVIDQSTSGVDATFNGVLADFSNDVPGL